MEQVGRGDISSFGLNDLTPPQYGEHQFDILYSEIDPSGYATPRGTLSGLSTPVQPRSRSISAENLAVANAISSGIPVSVLQSRLDSLNIAGLGGNLVTRERPHASEAAPTEENGTTRNGSVAQNGYFAPREPTSAGQTPGEDLSRHDSGSSEEAAGQQSPQHVEYSAEDLAKVPSYTTALRSNPRTPISEGLPAYHSVVHGPLPTAPRRNGSVVSIHNANGGTL